MRLEETHEGLTSKRSCRKSFSTGKVNTNTDVKSKSIAQIIAVGGAQPYAL